MKHLLATLLFTLMPLSVLADDNGIVSRRSPYSVPDTIDRLVAIAQQKGLTVFARIDHSGEAEKVGLKMRPTQLLIVGSPKAGTPLMNASPSLALDLPLEALAWEDPEGRVWVSYNSPEYLQKRHAIPGNLVKVLSGIAILVDAAVK